ncbi:MAG: glycosyltransferase family 4 protein [Colwellia sp.]
MDINIIEPVGGHGGMNYYNTGLCRGLAAGGEEVSLYTCDKTQEKSESKFFINKFFVNIYGSSNKIVRAFNFFIGLCKSVRDISSRNGKFCHVHFFHYGFLEFLTCSILKLFGLSIIATIHDVESFSQGKLGYLNKFILKLCSHFIVHNEFSKKELKSILEDVGLRRAMSVIPHGNYIPFLDKRHKGDAKRKLDLPDNKKVLLFFGQIKDVKGLEVLIEAFSKVKESNDDVVLLIAGKVWKTDFSKYQSQINQLGLSKNEVITHIKYIPDELVGDYYAAADLVVLPYKRIYQSGVLLMAMSYGKAVVTSNLEPMLEIIDNEKNGFTFGSEDSASLAGALSAALNQDSDIIGFEAYSLMKNEFSWEKIAEKHLEVYKKYA